MVTRIKPRRIGTRISFSATMPPSIDPETLRRMLEEVTGGPVEATPAPAPTRAPARVTLRNRNVRHDGRFPCRRKPDPLWAGAIIWPKGVPTEGCGRTYGSEAMRDAHEAGFADRGRTKPWNTRRFPHGCLDAIVPAHLRDTR